MKKSIIIAGAAATIGLASLVGVGVVSAQGGLNNQSSLVSALAKKFKLKEADVQLVFDEQHATNVTARQAEYKTKLDQAVKDGDLTQAQADKLIAKQKEMTSFMETLKDKTAEERRDAMRAKQAEFKQWCEDNDIPNQFMGFGMGRGKGMGMRMGNRATE